MTCWLLVLCRAEKCLNDAGDNLHGLAISKRADIYGDKQSCGQTTGDFQRMLGVKTNLNRAIFGKKQVTSFAGQPGFFGCGKPHIWPVMCQ